jgi:predicted deacylase
MNEILDLFPDSYESSWRRFRESLSQIRSIWPDAQISSHLLAIDKDLTTDWIFSEALDQNQQILILTTGEHGIEGFVGSAMYHRFINTILPCLNPQKTGILFIHAINPWGMKHKRRVNANNVDLNRNFVYQPEDINPSLNPEFSRLDTFLNPKKMLTNYSWSKIIYLYKLLWLLLTWGEKPLRYSILIGQYRYPKGLHYGGNSIQEETRLIMDLYRNIFQKFDHIIHLDMHTGYGPRYQMSLVNSAFESRSSKDLSKAFSYPLVVAATADEFYAIQGDMIDYVYTLMKKEFPHKRLYATSFEFGTYGESGLDLIRSLQTMIHENQISTWGTRNFGIEEQVNRDFLELFYPQEDLWKTKAIADADKAFHGILQAEGFIDNIGSF